MVDCTRLDAVPPAAETETLDPSCSDRFRAPQRPFCGTDKVNKACEAAAGSFEFDKSRPAASMPMPEAAMLLVAFKYPREIGAVSRDTTYPWGVPLAPYHRYGVGSVREFRHVCRKCSKRTRALVLERLGTQQSVVLARPPATLLPRYDTHSPTNRYSSLSLPLNFILF